MEYNRKRNMTKPLENFLKYREGEKKGIIKKEDETSIYEYDVYCLRCKERLNKK